MVKWCSANSDGSISEYLEKYILILKTKHIFRDVTIVDQLSLACGSQFSNIVSKKYNKSLLQFMAGIYLAFPC
jgi:hypothetical protein